MWENTYSYPAFHNYVGDIKPRRSDPSSNPFLLFASSFSHSSPQWWAKSNSDSIKQPFKSHRLFGSNITLFDPGSSWFDTDSTISYCWDLTFDLRFDPWRLEIWDGDSIWDLPITTPLPSSHLLHAFASSSAPLISETAQVLLQWLQQRSNNLPTFVYCIHRARCIGPYYNTVWASQHGWPTLWWVAAIPASRQLGY